METRKQPIVINNVIDTKYFVSYEERNSPFPSFRLAGIQKKKAREKFCHVYCLTTFQQTGKPEQQQQQFKQCLNAKFFIRAH